MAQLIRSRECFAAYSVCEINSSTSHKTRGVENGSQLDIAELGQPIHFAHSEDVSQHTHSQCEIDSSTSNYMLIIPLYVSGFIGRR